jgi:sarcosine oxidase subunit gamma
MALVLEVEIGRKSTMPDAATCLTAHSAFAGLSVKSSEGRGVSVYDRDGLGIATVLVRREKSVTLAQRVRDLFGIELPQGPRRSIAGDLAFAGIGPGAWVATLEGGGNECANLLAGTIGNSAAISDQTDGYAVLRMSGPRLRDTLSKLVPVDVHPRVFGKGYVSVTSVAQCSATLWRLDDRIDGSPVFEISVLRSFAASFWHALNESAAEYGLVVESPLA